jgi:NAD(P)-dependent dehydrogenase (short-subunit alcohol dehydrogenase family)
LGVNAKGLLSFLRAQIPYFNDGGSIVNAASVAGFDWFQEQRIVCCEQTRSCRVSFAILLGVWDIADSRSLMKVAAKELGSRQIRCNCFCPGPIDTPMFRQSAAIRGTKLDLSHIALNRAAHPSEAVNLVE